MKRATRVIAFLLAVMLTIPMSVSTVFAKGVDETSILGEVAKTEQIKGVEKVVSFSFPKKLGDSAEPVVDFSEVTKKSQFPDTTFSKSEAKKFHICGAGSEAGVVDPTEIFNGLLYGAGQSVASWAVGALMDAIFGGDGEDVIEYLSAAEERQMHADEMNAIARIGRLTEMEAIVNRINAFVECDNDYGLGVNAVLGTFLDNYADIPEEQMTEEIVQARLKLFTHEDLTKTNQIDTLFNRMGKTILDEFTVVVNGTTQQMDLFDTYRTMMRYTFPWESEATDSMDAYYQAIANEFAVIAFAEIMSLSAREQLCTDPVDKQVWQRHISEAKDVIEKVKDRYTYAKENYLNVEEHPYHYFWAPEYPVKFEKRDSYSIDWITSDPHREGVSGGNIVPGYWAQMYTNKGMYDALDGAGYQKMLDICAQYSSVSDEKGIRDYSNATLEDLLTWGGFNITFNKNIKDLFVFKVADRNDQFGWSYLGNKIFMRGINADMKAGTLFNNDNTKEDYGQWALFPSFTVPFKINDAFQNYNGFCLPLYDELAIETKEGFINFIKSVANGNTYVGKKVTLYCDIDLSGTNYTDIWTETQINSSFAGFFDGQNHTISNLNDPSGSCGGLFRTLSYGAEISNLILKNANVKSSSQNTGFGALAGKATGRVKINNVTVDGGTVSGSSRVGGLIGEANTVYLTMTGCSNSAAVSANTTDGDAGGIVGCGFSEMTISYCTNTGKISGTTVGGIIGRNEKKNTELTGCVNGKQKDAAKGVISGSGSAGGIAGYIGDCTNDPQITVLNCINYGKVSSSNAEAGGILGDLRTDNGSNSIRECKNHGEVSTSSTETERVGAGGIVGTSYGGGTIASCENYAVINSKAHAGGILGWNEDDSITFDKCKNTGTVTASYDAGGIAGWIGNCTKDRSYTGKNCTNSGTIKGSCAGGIVGTLRTDNPDNYFCYCTNSGAVTATGSGDQDGAGGIIGTSYGGGDVQCNTNVGHIKGKMNAGGILGFNEDDRINFNYSSNGVSGKVNDPEIGRVEGERHAGGIAANVENCTKDRRYDGICCKNYGKISGTDGVGGIIGRLRTDNHDCTFNQCENWGEIYNAGTGDKAVAGQIIGTSFGGGDLYSIKNKGKLSGPKGNPGGSHGKYYPSVGWNEDDGWSVSIEFSHIHTIDYQAISFKEWTSDHSLPETSGYYSLTKDVTLSDTWSIPTNSVVNLCLNGHIIKQTAADKRCITVFSGGTLNLYDCNEDGCEHAGYVDSNGLWHCGMGKGTSQSITGGVITGSTGGGVYIYSSGTFNMYGGTIAGNKVNTYGGGIQDDGVFNIYGGEICYNTAGKGGGGVYSLSAFANMYGGTISHNTAPLGGGVMTNNGSAAFNMYDGTISYNTGTKGGGVCSYYGTFRMNNGTIGNNDASYGAGVFNWAHAVFGGSSVVNDNANKNLYIVSGNPIDIGSGENGIEAPTADMKIGVALSKGKGVFSNTCADNYSANFSPDSTSYRIVYNGDDKVLELAVKDTIGPMPQPPDDREFLEKDAGDQPQSGEYGDDLEALKQKLGDMMEKPDEYTREEKTDMLDICEMFAQNEDIRSKMQKDEEFMALIDELTESVKAGNHTVDQGRYIVTLLGTGADGKDAPDWRYILSAKTIDVPEEVKAKLGKDWKVLAAEDITVTRYGGIPEGKFTLGFSGEEIAKYKNSEATVYHVTENGIEELKATWNEEKQCFEVTTDSCSPFVLAAKTEAKEDDPGKKEDTPETGDESHPVLWIVLGGIALIAMAGCEVVLRRERDN